MFLLFAILKNVLIILDIKYRECKPCNVERGTKRNSENKGKISNQQKKYYELNRDVLLAKSKLNQQTRKSHTQQIEELK